VNKNDLFILSVEFSVLERGTQTSDSGKTNVFTSEKNTQITKYICDIRPAEEAIQIIQQMEDR
jgi:hypothetical protein